MVKVKEIHIFERDPPEEIRYEPECEFYINKFTGLPAQEGQACEGCKYRHCYFGIDSDITTGYICEKNQDFERFGDMYRKYKGELKEDLKMF